jgi:glycosyltransferase AglD
MPDPEVSLIFPAYNEVEGMEKAVTTTLVELGKITPLFEIIVAEDGSSDGTDEIAEHIAAAHPEVRHLHSTERLGRGKALNRAFKEAHGSILIYMDVDLATDVTHLRALIDAIRAGANIATGSRMLPDSRVTRSTRRSLTSWCYNTLIRTLFGTPVHDHQCGFKAFNKARLIEYIDEVEDNHWFWDTEVLIRGHNRGLVIAEIPIDWVEARGTKVKLFRDSYQMGLKALSLWWRLHTG